MELGWAWKVWFWVACAVASAVVCGCVRRLRAAQLAREHANTWPGVRTPRRAHIEPQQAPFGTVFRHIASVAPQVIPWHAWLLLTATWTAVSALQGRNQFEAWPCFPHDACAAAVETMTWWCHACLWLVWQPWMRSSSVRALGPWAPCMTGCAWCAVACAALWGLWWPTDRVAQAWFSPDSVTRLWDASTASLALFVIQAWWVSRVMSSAKTTTTTLVEGSGLVWCSLWLTMGALTVLCHWTWSWATPAAWMCSLHTAWYHPPVATFPPSSSCSSRSVSSVPTASLSHLSSLSTLSSLRSELPLSARAVAADAAAVGFAGSAGSVGSVGSLHSSTSSLSSLIRRHDTLTDYMRPTSPRVSSLELEAAEREGQDAAETNWRVHTRFLRSHQHQTATALAEGGKSGAHSCFVHTDCKGYMQ